MKYKSKTPIYKEINNTVTLEETLIYPTIAAIAKHEDTKKEIEVLFRKYTQEEAVAIFDLEKFDSKLIYFETFPLEERVKMLKLYAVIRIVEEIESEQNAYELLEKLIIQGHKRMYDYYQRNKELNLVNLVQFIESRYEGDIESLQPLLISMYFFLQCSDTGFNAAKDYMLEQYYIYNLKSSFSGAKIVEQLNLISKEEEIQALEALKKVTGIQLKKDVWVSKLFSGMETVAIKKLKKGERNIVSQSGNYKPIYNQPFVRDLKTYFGFLPFYKVNDIQFTDSIKYTRKQLFDSYYIYLYNIKEGRYTEEEREDMLNRVLAHSIFAATLFGRYNTLSESYVSLLNEAEGVDTKQATIDLKVKEQLLKKENEEHKTALKVAEHRNKELEEYIAKLEGQLKDNTNEQEEFTELKKEVVQLREVVFSADEEESVEEATFTEAELASLDKINVAVIGGHTSYANRLRKHISHLRHVEPEEKTIDLSFIKQMDVVMFYTSYNNHVLYQRFKKEWDKKDMKVLFISKTSNSEQMVKKVLEKIK